MKHAVIIDPAQHTAEVECFNRLVLTAPLPLTYHLPGIYGMQSLAAEDLTQVAGIVILGSAASVHDRKPWQIAFETWLESVLARGMPTLGLCYGHQLLAYLYGGEVGFLTPDQLKVKGLRRVAYGAGHGWERGEADLVVSHREAVTKLGPDLEVLAVSPQYAIDGLKHRRLPIYGFQAHPEAVGEFLRNHDIDSSAQAALAGGHKIVDGFLQRVAQV